MSLELLRVSDSGQDALCFASALVTGLTIGNTVGGNAFSVWTALSPIGGGIFGAVMTLGSCAAFLLDTATGATKCFGDTLPATIARVALYILTGAAIATATIALAGFSITLADAAILATALTVFDFVSVNLGFLCFSCQLCFLCGKC